VVEIWQLRVLKFDDGTPSPAEEEGRLNDMPLRENFIEPVLPVENARQGLLSLLGDARRKDRQSWQDCAGPLMRFHSAHKLTRKA